MTELENLMADADALGIKYRTDIKAETLQKKIDEYNKVNNPSAVKVEVKAAEPSKFNTYKNTSKVNLFTEAGRCHPDRIIQLTTEEAAKYQGLELCG